MSTKKIETVIKICDVCGKEVKEFASAGETRPKVIYRFSTMIYYGSEKEYDFCADCSDKVIDFLDAIKGKTR